jgi:hypothetical protein
VHNAVGFAPDEIDTSAPTRSARLKWVIVVNETLTPGLAVNAAICAAAATSPQITGLLGQDAPDAEGNIHPGLPWAGCSVLVADSATLRTIRAKAAAHPETFVADMPAAAQQTRVYNDYLSSVATTPAEAIDYYAVSIVGPRNRVDRLVGRLALLP